MFTSKTTMQRDIKNAHTIKTLHTHNMLADRQTHTQTDRRTGWSQYSAPLPATRQWDINVWRYRGRWHHGTGPNPCGPHRANCCIRLTDPSSSSSAPSRWWCLHRPPPCLRSHLKNDADRHTSRHTDRHTHTDIPVIISCQRQARIYTQSGRATTSISYWPPPTK